MTKMPPATSGAPDADSFAAIQWEYFQAADKPKFRWQTTCPVLASAERQLVSVAAGDGPLLEIGCGEGGNLFHLGPRNRLTAGLDYSTAKAVFASSVIPWARFVCADAIRLPFRDGVFDRVLCRDVLHHVHEAVQHEVVSELFRVCRPGGEVVLIESNGRNPLIRALAVILPAEREVLRSTPGRVASLVGGLASRVSVEMAQPLPVARALLHYRFGRPGLGHKRIVVCMLRALEVALNRLFPRCLWAYIVVRGRVCSGRSEGNGGSKDMPEECR